MPFGAGIASSGADVRCVHSVLVCPVGEVAAAPTGCLTASKVEHDGVFLSAMATRVSSWGVPSKMARTSPPTTEDHATAIRVALSGAARGDDAADIAAQLAPLHPRNDTFPGELLLELAADAIALSGASRHAPIEFEGIRERYLPEAAAHTRAQQDHSKFAVRAAAMLRAGVDPGLLDEVSWWRSDDLWFWSLEAFIVYVRVAADRTGDRVDAICRQLADLHHVTLDDDNR